MNPTTTGRTLRTFVFTEEAFPFSDQTVMIAHLFSSVLNSPRIALPFYHYIQPGFCLVHGFFCIPLVYTVSESKRLSGLSCFCAPPWAAGRLCLEPYGESPFSVIQRNRHVNKQNQVNRGAASRPKSSFGPSVLRVAAKGPLGTAASLVNSRSSLCPTDEG